MYERWGNDLRGLWTKLVLSVSIKERYTSGNLASIATVSSSMPVYDTVPSWGALRVFKRNPKPPERGTSQ